MNKRKVVRVLAMGMASTMILTAFPVEAKTDSNNSIKDKYSDEGYTLVWNDEFDGDSLDLNDWNVEQHEPGWVNSELQRYTGINEGNIEVKDGKLSLKPHVTENESSEDVEEVAEEKVTNVSFDFDFSADDSNSIALQVNFGKIASLGDAGAAPATVKISNISLVDETDDVQVLSDREFKNGEWNCGFNSPGEGSCSFEDGKAVIEIKNSGDENWHIQLQQSALQLKKDHHYSFSMDASASADRGVEISVLDPDNNWAWYGGTAVTIEGSALAGGSSSSGKREITSGRITTQNKHDFTYGRFEARAKVPSGKGYLPAFWLMATDEGLYGQWPKCGEMDIMEVMGQDTTTSYHTIHYGYSSGSGHKENQKSKTITDSDFADEYHVFRMDWEPGKITWYVDDEQVFTTNDWYTGTDDNNQVTYPAPFDQDFYVILNLAVGGSWVGNPDDSTYEHMNDDSYDVDYVRVYQKSAEDYEKAESEAKPPVKEPVKYREPDEDGNYVINGDFSQDIAIDGAEDASDDNWKLHLESDAKNTDYTVSGNKIKISPSQVGSQAHSVQLKQQNIPMYKGWEYELTFDAVAEEDRDIIIDVEGPDRGWTRYMQDTSVALSTKKQSYKYTFTMNDKTDPNSSLEFNLGKQNSTAAVTISNVKLTHKAGDEIVEDDAKEIRPDGNYIYNGGFDQGENRLGYWEINNKKAVSVTNKKNTRLLKVEVPEGTSKTNPVIVSQKELSPISAGQYEISFDAYTEDGAADGLTVEIAGRSIKPELTSTLKSFSKKVTVEKSLSRSQSEVEFSFTKPGTYYVDNVFFTEAALIKNGSFNAGIAGFSPYIYDSVNANYVIDSMNGNDNTFAMTIEDTVADTDDNCWYVQLNQDGVTLEKGKTYTVSFKAKSSIDRVIKYSLQEFEGAWTNYSGTGSVEIGPEWKTFTHTFTMENETDTNTRFNITMGSVDGVRITEKHDVYIDDISLIEVTEDEPETPAPAKPSDSSAPSTPSNTSAPSNTSTSNASSSSSNSESSSSSVAAANNSTNTVVASNVTSPVAAVATQEATKPVTTKSQNKSKTSETSDAQKQSTTSTEDTTEEETSEQSSEEELKEKDIVQGSENANNDDQQNNEETKETKHRGFFAAIADFFKAILDFFRSLFS